MTRIEVSSSEFVLILIHVVKTIIAQRIFMNLVEYKVERYAPFERLLKSMQVHYITIQTNMHYIIQCHNAIMPRSLRT